MIPWTRQHTCWIIASLCTHLVELPERRHVPPVLDRIGVTAYREVHFQAYRVIYEISGRDGVYPLEAASGFPEFGEGSRIARFAPGKVP